MRTSARILLFAASIFVISCGARDDKNAVDDYPTYDTTSQPNTVNDSSTGGQQEGGNIRHNIDDQSGEK